MEPRNTYGNAVQISPQKKTEFRARNSHARENPEEIVTKVCPMESFFWLDISQAKRGAASLSAGRVRIPPETIISDPLASALFPGAQTRF